MKRMEVCLICLLAIFVVSTFGFILIPQQIKAINEFEHKAEEYLGTDDFVISMADITIAYTEDGRQYPPKEDVATYYRNKLTHYSILGLSGLALFGLMAWYLGKDMRKEEV